MLIINERQLMTFQLATYLQIIAHIMSREYTDLGLVGFFCFFFNEERVESHLC